MKVDRLVYLLLIVQTLILFGLGYRFRDRGAQLAVSGAEADHLAEKHREEKAAMLALRENDLKHTGQVLGWPVLAAVNDSGEMPEPIGGFRLVVYLSESSCNVCRDRMVSFAASFQRSFPAIRVTVIIEATSARYVRRLLPVNQVDYEVFHDPQNAFAAKRRQNRSSMRDGR